MCRKGPAESDCCEFCTATDIPVTVKCERGMTLTWLLQVESPSSCYSDSYTICDQKCFIISEVVADWHELMIL